MKQHYIDIEEFGKDLYNNTDIEMNEDETLSQYGIRNIDGINCILNDNGSVDWYY